MRSLTSAWLLVALVALLSAPAIAQDTPVPQQPPAQEASGLTWKAALMAGDNELDVFDNATKR